MAASTTVGKMKNDGKKRDSAQNIMTINFIPEIQRYSKPANMEEHIRSYFEKTNGINRRIIAEERKIIAQHRNTWSSLPVEERDELLNDRFISNDIRQKYNTSNEYWKEKTSWQIESPRDETTDNSLNDSFSKPFQWATKSQRNLKFPVVKSEKPIVIPEDKQSDEKQVVTKDVLVKRIHNVDESQIEKPNKTKNENINTSSHKFVNSKTPETTTKLTAVTNSYEKPVEIKEKESSEPAANNSNDDNIAASDNILDFLNSWNP